MMTEMSKSNVNTANSTAAFTKTPGVRGTSAVGFANNNSNTNGKQKVIVNGTLRTIDKN